ncbi:Kunitz trypsin inhibitor 5 [Linum grandiflorum]
MMKKTSASAANAMLAMAIFTITLSSAYAARSLAETLATSSLTPLPVLDVDGKVVRSGTTYYAIPATSGEGGGVALASMTKDPESCPQTVVQDEDEISQGISLTFAPVNSKSGTGGVEGNPGPRTVKNWFKIWKYGSNYKFSYCPAVCKSCKVDCKDVGIYVDENGGRRLALVDKEGDPFVVKFVKAT